MERLMKVADLMMRLVTAMAAFEKVKDLPDQDHAALKYLEETTDILHELIQMEIELGIDHKQVSEHIESYQECERLIAEYKLMDVLLSV